MFKINRKIEYALIALKHMSAAVPEALTSAKEICDIYHTPFDPTSRVLQLMAQDGILRAEHGAHGGYSISKDLAKVTFSDLIEIITGPIQIANCFHENHSHCELTHSCNVISPMLNLNERMFRLFKDISVKDLIGARHSAERNIKSKPVENVVAKNYSPSQK